MTSLHSIVDLLNSSINIGNDNPTFKRQMLELAYNQLGKVLNPPRIEDMQEIYSNEGIIPAIKAWRSLTGLALGAAKAEIDTAAKLENWTHFFVGKTVRITDEFHIDYGVSAKVISVNQWQAIPTCIIQIYDGDDPQEIELSSVQMVI